MNRSDESVCCECTPVVGTRFGGANGRLPSEAVIEAVAAAEGVAPTELDPLYGDVDLDSVNRLFSTAGPPSTLLQCSVSGWNVFIRGDGALRVCDPGRVTDPAPVFEKALVE